MLTQFGPSWVDSVYKEHREHILLDREKSLLPATQPVVETLIRDEQFDNEIKEEMNHIRMLRKEIENARMRIWEIEAKKHNKTSNKERQQFIRKCPKEDCRGFLSTQWKCGLCENYTCPDCNELVGKTRNEEHKCDPNHVETTKLLAKDTKPCPSCGTGIFKIEGCDQMFCTQCNTPFSWRTGKIETGQIHNPHYFEYMKRTGRLERNPLDIQCGREVDNHFVYDLSRLMLRSENKEKYNTDSYRRSITAFCRCLIHIRYQNLPLWQINNRDDNLQLRIQYLRNRITEEEFKKALQRKEKENLKKTEISNIIRVFLDCSTDILYRYRDYLLELDREFVDVFAEVHSLVLYANECLHKVSQVYKSRQYQIDSDWVFGPKIN